LKELEAKSITAEDELSEMKSDVEALRLNLHLCNGRVKGNSDKIKILEDLIAQL